MLHARIEVSQIMSLFQVRAVITEFAPGTDPVQWSSPALTIDLPEDVLSQDALSITMECIRVWSEVTIPR